MLGVAAFSSAATASDNSAADAAVLHIQKKWETTKFAVPEGDKQTQLMNGIGTEADAIAAQYPDNLQALIWDGILTSERTSLAGPFSALGLAKRARDILEKAYARDPAALDAGAPTSLGVLYYRVPGFPIGFGDVSKARQLLEEATRTAPNGLDAWYFYGDFLYAQGEYANPRSRCITRSHCQPIVIALVASSIVTIRSSSGPEGNPACFEPS